MIKQIVFYFLLCFSLKNADAESSNESNNGEIQLSSELDIQKAQQISKQRDSLNDLLADIEKRYGETAAILKKLHNEIGRKHSSLDRIRLEMSRLDKEINSRSKELAGQIKSAYTTGQKEKLKLLLNQQDPGLSNRMLNYYNYLNKDRIRKLAEINRSIQRLNDLEKYKLRETAQLEKKLGQKKSEQVILDRARKQRHELLAQINDNSIPSTEQLSQLSESENKLKDLIASLQDSGDPGIDMELSKDQELSETPLKDDVDITSSGSESNLSEDWASIPRSTADFSRLKGKLPWPIKGRLLEKFGNPRSDSVWDGVLIDAKEGADIHAVNSGKIVYAQWLRGYGLLMIIDHGQGFMTLYAFNQSLYKHIGETVYAGDIIASVGQSGGRSQSGLYFGIRKKGTPVNPLEWCRK